jgi:DNA-binding IclR family transcriptional regulator
MKSGTEFHNAEPKTISNNLQPITAVVRAAAVLRAFTHEQPLLHFSEIVARVGLPKSTTHRLLATLIQVGFVEQRGNGTYALGIGLFEVGSLAYANLSLRSIAQSYIRSLTEEIKETVHMGVLDGFEVVSIEEASSPHLLRAEVYVGKRAPLHCTAVGKAILAFADEPGWLARYRRRPLERFTAATIRDHGVLEAELDKIRRQGFAVDDQEHEVGVRCVGAPIRDASGNVVGSLSISGPSARITPETLPSLSQRLLEVTAEISATLGYVGEGGL